MPTITIVAFECIRCGHKWAPRRAFDEFLHKPKVCPKCKSPYWDTPRRNEKREKQ